MSPNQLLQNAATKMAEAADAGRSVVTVLKRICPDIYRQIRRDRKYPGLLDLWGRSVNLDENAGQIIVHPGILQAIGELAEVPMRDRVVHAGLTHTYGYLFSLIQTPYGAKRDRWTRTDLEEGFGFDLSLLSEQPKEGTLFANVTWFLGQIAYRGCPESLRRLGENAVAPSPELINFDYCRLKVCRIAEEVVLEGKTRRKITLFTDLVPFPRPPRDRKSPKTLLIYSVQNGERSPIKLITGFPVQSEVVRGIKASVSEKKTVEVRLQYNAYLAGLYGRMISGRRFYVGAPD
jgi:hypothetical protein